MHSWTSRAIRSSAGAGSGLAQKPSSSLDPPSVVSVFFSQQPSRCTMCTEVHPAAATEAGVATSHGCRFFRDTIVDHDSELVARQRRAGFVFIGKTSASELGILPVTETAAWGVTRNPWNLERTPGGSSGGSAAAVAA